MSEAETTVVETARTQTTTAIIELSLRRSDPVYRLLRHRWGITPLVGYLIVGLVPFVFETIFCFFNNCLISNSRMIGIWNDYLGYYNFLVAFPASVAFYLWLPEQIADIFATLESNKVIRSDGLPDGKAADFEESRKHILENSWLWKLGTLTAIGLTFGLILPGTTPYVAFWNQHFVTQVIHHAIALLVVFAIVMIVIRISQLVLILRRMFQSVEVDVRALHPDGSGGLGTLGRFSVRISYFIAILGIDVVLSWLLQEYLLGGKLGELGTYFQIVLFLGAYLIVVPVVFFAPLATAHTAMKRARERDLLLVAGRFESEYEELKFLLQEKDRPLEEEIGEIEQLKKLHGIIDDFPVWPLNVNLVLRFVASVALPLSLTILATIIESMLQAIATGVP